MFYERFLGGGVSATHVATPADTRCADTSNESVFPVRMVLICQDLGKGGIRCCLRGCHNAEAGL